MVLSSSNKRQRTAEQSLNISNLPDGILSHVASYLAKPSRALFAIAMTSTPESRTKDNFSISSEYQQTTVAILQSEQWDVLDFEDIEKSLAAKLTDIDLHAVLKCISAQDVLKKLKLSGCLSITGRCLELLRGSTIIEHIDLSLVTLFESPKLDPEPIILEEAVLPILDSIISMNGISLKMIVFPKKWRTAKTDRFAQFLTNYNRLLESREPKCLNCEASLFEEREYALMSSNDYYGTQSYCCHNCYHHFCYDCDDSGMGPLYCCETCDKECCADCAQIRQCDKCVKSMCTGCSEIKTCQLCEEDFCIECGSESADLYCKTCVPENKAQNLL